MRMWHSLGLLAALSAGAAGCATASSVQDWRLSAAMPPAGEGAVLAPGLPAPAPQGLADWCARAGECEQNDHPDGASVFARLLAARAQGASSDGARAEMMLTPERWDELRLVNRGVNAAIAPQAETDVERPDYWQTPLAAVRPAGARVEGDCEDYALEKRARLRALGWRSEALSLAVAALPRGGAHAVLIAQTDRGDIVLDNLSDEPRHVGQLRYNWLSRQHGPSLMSWAEARVLERRSQAPDAEEVPAEPDGFFLRALLGPRRTGELIRDSLARRNPIVQNY